MNLTALFRQIEELANIDAPLGILYVPQTKQVWYLIQRRPNGEVLARNADTGVLQYFKPQNA
jgi:hypothetical protein